MTPGAPGQASATIVIGFDGSDDAEGAIRQAAALLAPRRAIVAYVWDSLAELLLHTEVDELSGSMREAADELDAEEAREAEQVALRGAELAAAAGLEAIPTVARGRPRAWPTLLALAQEHDASALVVGSRGLGRVRSALLGSVSSGVLDHAHLPVLIVPPVAGPATGPVLVGYDGSEQARAALEAAGGLLKVREVLLQTAWTSSRRCRRRRRGRARRGRHTRGAGDRPRRPRARAAHGGRRCSPRRSRRPAGAGRIGPGRWEHV